MPQCVKQRGIFFLHSDSSMCMNFDLESIIVVFLNKIYALENFGTIKVR